MSQISTLRWNEDITLKNIDSFRMAMQSFIQQEESHLILNIARVSYLNSAALGIMADSVIKAKKNNKVLVIGGVQSSVEEIFQIVKFETFINIFSEYEEAVKFFEKPV